MTVAVRILLLVLVTATACRSSRVPAPPAPKPVSTAMSTSGPGATPRSRAEFPTTSGDLALSNLDSQIAGIEKQAGRPGSAPGLDGRLASLLLLRGQILGRTADYQRADNLAAAAVEAAPKSPEARQVLASVHATLHRFAAAEQALASAEALGVNPRELEAARAGVLEATGRTEEALVIRERDAAAHPMLATQVALATLVAQLGQDEKAAQLFVSAQDGYRDTSPFPLAYAYLQEGLAAERRGKLSRARELFEAALERVPGYAPTASHLAGALPSMGQRQQAATVLEALIKTSDDPEFVGQLAVLLRDEGRKQEAEVLFNRAESAYEKLLSKMPDAFGEHAARFYLARGHRADRALALARANLSGRPTPQAFGLAIDASVAAGDPREACVFADSLRTRKPLTVAARVYVARAYHVCGRRNEAQSMLAEVVPGL